MSINTATLVFVLTLVSHVLPQSSPTVTSYAYPLNTTKIVIGISLFDLNNPFVPAAFKEMTSQAFNGTDFFLYKLAQSQGLDWDPDDPLANPAPVIRIPVPGAAAGTTWNVSLELRVFMSGNNTGDYVAMCNDPEVGAVIGPILINFNVPAAAIINDCGKIYMSSGSLPWTLYETKYTYAFQTITFAEKGLEDKLPYFRLAGVNNVAFLWAEYNDYAKVLCGKGMTDYAPVNEINVVYKGPMIHNFTWANETDVIRHVQGAIDSGADGLILCVFHQAAIPIARYLKQVKKAFQITLLAPDRNYQLYLTPEEAEYFTVASKNHPAIKSYTDRFFTNPNTGFQTYFSEYKARYGVDPDPTTGYYYYSLYGLVYMFEHLQLAGSICTRPNNTLFTTFDLSYSMARVVMPTLFSTITYDVNHRCLSTEVTIQFRNNTSYVVAPPQASNSRMITDAPTWAQRVYSNALSSAEIGFTALAVIFIGFSAVMMLIVVVVRETSLIRASMPSFLLLILCGSILIDIGVILWRYHNISTASCHLRVWCIAIGFIIMFGGLITKSFRVWFLWSRGMKSQRVVTNGQLGIFVGIGVLITAILCAIYSGAGGVEAQVVVKDDIRPGLNIETCYENNNGKTILYVLVALALLTMLIGLIFSFLTRKIPFLAFNESKIILFSMYNVIFFAILTVIVIHLQIEPEVIYILRSLCILLSSFLTVLIMMGTKLWYLKSDKNARSKKQSGGGSSHSGSNTGTGTGASATSTK